MSITFETKMYGIYFDGKIIYFVVIYFFFFRRIIIFFFK